MNFFSRKTSETEQQLKQLYKNWPEVRRFLASLGCDKLTAEDLFQEALLIYIRKIEDSSFQLTVEPIYYVKNTCKLLWFNLARKNQRNPHVTEEIDLREEESDWLENEMKLVKMETILSKIGKQCQDILKLFYGGKMSMEDIAKEVGLRNDKVVKAQKYRCIQKAKDLLQCENEAMNETTKESINFSFI
jgi:RNA polymerase sigma factor (sigma-70 family)